MAASVPVARSVFVRFPVYYGWVSVVVAAIAMVTTLAGNDQGLGLITESLLKDLGIDKVEWSNINLAATLIGALFVIPTGRLIDRFGSRVMLTAILLPLGVTVICMSRATFVWQLWITAILTSILGQSALSVASMALVGKWFGRRISMAMGVYAILIVIGYIIAFSLLGPNIIANGWRGPWNLFGCTILFFLTPLAWLAVRSTPESVGLHGEFQNNSVEQSGIPLRQALATQIFWMFVLSTAFFDLIISAVGLFYESILKEHGFDPKIRDLVLGIQVVAGLLANFAGGWIGMRCSLARLMAGTMALLAAALLLLANLSSMATVILYAAAMGATGGLVMVIFFAVWGHVFGRKHLGKIQGVAQGICITAVAFGPRIVAQVQQSTHSYTPAFYAFAAISVLFAAWAWFVPMRASAGSGIVPP